MRGETRFDRRELLVGAALAPLAGGAEAQAQAPAPRTHTYKRVGELAIQADVWTPAADGPRPVALWIHGGALILGSRKSPPRALLTGWLAAGYAVVSIDYRLAPETQLPGIIEDVEDAYRWIRAEGPTLFGADPNRIGVAGGSAGGYLTLMTGFRVEPRPRVLVAFWGYGELTTSWYAEPSEFYRKQPLVTREEALAAVGPRPLSEPPSPNQRGRFYLWTRQQGLWPQQVTGHDPKTESRWYDRYCPLRQVTREYPPTLLIHGTEDTDVPYSESRAMADRFREVGVVHELLTVEGAGHGLSGAPPADVERSNNRALAFFQTHLSPNGKVAQG